MSTTDQNIDISLPKDDALILFDWLARFNEGSIHTTDEVEKQILFNLEATFEKLLVEPFAANYNEIIALTKARIRDKL